MPLGTPRELDPGALERARIGKQPLVTTFIDVIGDIIITLWRDPNHVELLQTNYGIWLRFQNGVLHDVRVEKKQVL